jgi:hypothetical protein
MSRSIRSMAFALTLIPAVGEAQDFVRGLRFIS